MPPADPTNELIERLHQAIRLHENDPLAGEKFIRKVMMDCIATLHAKTEQEAKMDAYLERKMKEQPTPALADAAPVARADWAKAATEELIKRLAPEIAAMKDDPEWHPNMYQSRFDDALAIILKHAAWDGRTAQF